MNKSFSSPYGKQALDKLIEHRTYANHKLNDLELVFNISARIRKLPAGLKVARRWALFRDGLAA